MKKQDLYGVIAELLGSLDIAMCVFDRDDCAVIWNSTFFVFFPEHEGAVFPGEHYRENLKRFYGVRLKGEHLSNIELYIEEGVDRHRRQSRPFTFTHRGRRLRVASLPLPDGGRMRIWLSLSSEAQRAQTSPEWGEIPIDLLEYLADGAMVLDKDDRIIASNMEFRRLYDVAPGHSVVGATLIELVQEAWERAGYPGRAQQLEMLDHMNFAGMPFEVELPGGRWRRVIAHRTAHGIGYFTHSDITPLKQAVSDLHTIAVTDALTGLANRRRFDEVCEEEWRRRSRDGTDIALLLIDVDHFKLVNDRHGHIVGDECLRRVASILKGAILRSADLAARHGGEEFAVLLPDTGVSGAMAVAERIREAMAQEDWSAIHPGLGRITASFGICSGTPALHGSVTDFIRYADAALYQAKKEGRDRIIMTRLAEAVPFEGEL